MFAPKNILVPTDFSAESDEALKEALELARQYDARVYLMHVTEPVTQCTGDYCLDASAVRQAENEEFIMARRQMDEEIAKFANLSDVEVIGDIRNGDPVGEILKEQNERNVDLIVMPSHRKTGLLRKLMGPITERVMEEAKTPVLLVRH
ncbi:MAG: universal stress protein [Smithellaceae bacterium]